MHEFFRLLIAAVLSAFLSGYLIRRWQYREDHIARRVDNLVEEIEAAAHVGIDYWLLDPTDGELSKKERRAIEADVARNGARILALQHQIAALRSSLQADIYPDDNNVLIQCEAAFFDAATSGDFGVASRAPDLVRVRVISGAAAKYVNQIRSAYNRRSWAHR
jgi:hypothetical protein